MNISEKAIVLHKIKYTDNSIIATLYVENVGTTRFLIKNITSKQNRHLQALIQPLNIVHITFTKKSKFEVHFIKEITAQYIYQQIPFSLSKNTLLTFLNELLYKTLRNSENDASLFSFINDQLITLDKTEDVTSQFHLHFLVQFIEKIGLQPLNNYTPDRPYFSIEQSSFIEIEDKNFPVNEVESKTLYQLLKGEKSVMNKSCRNNILQTLVDYIIYHNEELTKMDALPILKHVCMGE